MLITWEYCALAFFFAGLAVAARGQRCPPEQLFCGGSGPLPAVATTDPAMTTTACRAPSVVPELLPTWQQAAWAARPLISHCFSACWQWMLIGTFYLAFRPIRVLLVPDSSSVEPFRLPKYRSAFDARAAFSAVVAAETAAGWVLPRDTPPPFVAPTWGCSQAQWVLQCHS